MTVAAVERVVSSCRRLVDLALWLADYYGRRRRGRSSSSRRPSAPGAGSGGAGGAREALGGEERSRPS